MSLYNYFNKLGTVNYNGELVNNIISSIRFKDIINNINANYYPYTIKEGERADSIAAFYYDDPRYAWLVYLSNFIVDPYYEWPLSSYEFNEFLKKKYGSIEKAINKILFFRTNWNTDDTILSISAYEALTPVRKKYWSPYVNMDGTATSYRRKEDESVVETNKIISVTVSSTTNYITGETVTQSTSGIITGTAEIKFIDAAKLTLIHVNGSFAETSGGVGSIIGSTSNATRTCTNVTEIYNAISNDEYIYWTSVSAYDYENEINESRKFIYLIDKQYVVLIEDKISELLR